MHFEHEHDKNVNTSKNKPKPNLRIKIPFLSKGVELLKLENIINSDKLCKTLPDFIKIRKPCIIYKYKPPIRNTIFNYDETLNNIDDYKNIKCTCNDSKYCNDKIGHIVTGNLNIIHNEKLKKLFTYGTSYRIPQSNNWNTIYYKIKQSINESLETWSKKEHIDIRIFNEWKDMILQYVKHKIEKINKMYNTVHMNKTMYDDVDMINVLEDANVKRELEDLHTKYVIVNADKASNNIIVICKRYYLDCMRNELGLNENTKEKNKTYEHVTDSTKDDIIQIHKRYMDTNNIQIPDKWTQLPKLYHIPKMHKTPPKQRYIAASNKCTTKPLSNMITKCLKLILLQHRKYCTTMHNRTGVNAMWITDNSKNVLNTIDKLNDTNKAKDVYTYDFSTLYTMIPHDDLKEQMKWIMDIAFFNKSKKYIYVSSYNATWYKRKNTIRITKEQLIEYIDYLIDNIYFTVGDNVFRQKIGIPMGTDCAPYLANLYLYALECKYLKKLMKDDIHTARRLSLSYRFIDDLLMFNTNGIMDEHKTNIYPKELILNKENKTDNHCTFLDLDITIKTNTIHTCIYDKRDDFNFTINNFPNLSGNIHAARSHGIVISQLIRFCKACIHVDDFIDRSKSMITKLLNQHFIKHLLKKKVSNFYDKYDHLLQKYNISKRKMIQLIFDP